MMNRVHSKTFTAKPKDAPDGWYMIVQTYPLLQMAEVMSEDNGKIYTVIL